MQDAHRKLLSRINAHLPSGVDWKAGAGTYLSQVFERDGRENVEPYLFLKPFARLRGPFSDETHQTFVDLSANFLNAIQLLQLPARSRILDVACGAGWLTHYLTRLGFDVVGLDLSQELIDYAKRRLNEDRFLGRTPEEVDRMFVRIDIEEEPLPERLGTFDAAIFESCVHHFFDPVSALGRVANVLSRPHGLALLIEGENRVGAVKPQYVEEMMRWQTIERPYARPELIEALELAGLGQVEFLGRANGWMSPRDPRAGDLHGEVLESSLRCNHCIAAPAAEALTRVMPWRGAEDRPWRLAEGFTTDGQTEWSWSQPSSRLEMSAASRLQLEVRSPIPVHQGVDQHVAAFTHQGRRQWVKLTPQQPSGSLRFDDLRAGEAVYLSSDRVFSPAWQGESDARILSFDLRVRESESAGEARDDRPAAGGDGFARTLSRLFKGKTR